MYGALRRLLFCLPPEVAHSVAMKSLQAAYHLQLYRFLAHYPAQPCRVMGLDFPHIVGLAAGIDKDGKYIDALGALPFGFIEIGTLTPKPQSGNPKPRLFRLIEEEALINRMGFNNQGIDAASQRLAKSRYRGILGINIGKNAVTPNEEAYQDYIIGFKKLAGYASYFTVNVSSPNTAGLRALQQKDVLTTLLKAMKHEQAQYFTATKKYIPVVVKLDSDLSLHEREAIVDVLLLSSIDGVIVSNTTIHRENVRNPIAQEKGGLSGAPLFKRSTECLSALVRDLDGKMPVIASGGVMSAEHIQQKLDAGAKLVQVYTGFIYHGLNLLRY